MPKGKATVVENVYKNKYWYGGSRPMMGGAYFLVFIGAAVYFVQHVSGFWPTILAILKAIVWPALLIYKVFTLLHM